MARERLFAKFAAAPQVAWVTAPPGSGKTTLAASYVAQSPSSALWYEVDTADADPASFFQVMRQLAARAAGTKKATRLPVVPREGGFDLAVFARRFFRILFSVLPQRTWVFDNVQEAEGEVLPLILREAFEELPHGSNTIVLCLTDPPPALARLVANGVIRLLSAADLRFTRGESDCLVLSKLDADPRTLAEIHEASAGWAAGLVLMIEHLRRAGPAPVPSVDASQEAVFDYFAGEILARCAPEEQRALMLCASLPRVVPRLATVMGVRIDAGLLLERLRGRHLFVERHEGSEPSYQFHRLFRLFLAARAQDTLPANERVEALNRAAAALVVDGFPEEAIALYLSTCEWDAATTLIERHAWRVHEEGRWRSLCTWIAALPAAFLDRAWPGYWAGASLVWIDPPRARAHLEQAFHRFAAAGDRSGQILAAGMATRACILDVDWRQLDVWIEALESLLSGNACSVVDEVQLFGFARLVYAATARRPEHPCLDAWAKRTGELLRSPGIAPGDVVMAAYSLLFHSFGTGRGAEGRQVVRETAPLLEDPRVSATHRIHWRFAEANCLLRFGDPREALATMDEALAEAAADGLKIEGVIRRHRIFHLLILGRLDEAGAELDKLASAPRVEPYFELRAWLAWQQGRYGLALDEAHEALRQATQRGRTFYRDLDRALLAAICASSGRHDEALAHLARYRRDTASTGEFAAFQAAWVEAHVELARGDRAACRVALRRALAIGSEHGIRSYWGQTPAMIAPLLAEALEHGISPDYCRELIRLHRLRPNSPGSPSWPWPVRIRTLGRFTIELDGVAMRFAGKAQRKPLQLLQTMIAFGDRPMAIEQLMATLWPHPDDRGRKAFDITVHRLRRLLASDAAVSVADRHVSLDTRWVWVDTWTVDAILNSLVPLAGPVASADRLEAEAPRILELLEGPFLVGEPESAWLLATRHRLDDRLKRFADHLGRQWEAMGHWGRACELYRCVTEIDPLAEPFYRRQMQCLRAQGHGSEAIEVYRRCRQMLAATAGIVPALETERAYRELSAP